MGAWRKSRTSTWSDFPFSFLYLLCEHSQRGPPSFCPGGSQLWPRPTAPSEQATMWSLGARPQLPLVGMQGQTSKSSITYPTPPNLSDSGPGFWGVCEDTLFSGHPALPVPGWGSQITGWFLGHSDLFKMLLKWWYPSMLKNLKSIANIIKQCYGEC